MATETTRRALLGCAGLVTVSAIAPALASTGPAPSTAKWDELVAVFRAADAKMKATGIEHDTLWARYMAERDKLGELPKQPVLDSFEFDVESPRPIGEMTLAEIKATPLKKSAAVVAYEAALAEWTAKDDALELAITGDVDARWEAAVDAQDSAAHALFAEPSPNADAMRFKLALADESYEGSEIPTSVTRRIFADVRRLLAVGAA